MDSELRIDIDLQSREAVTGIGTSTLSLITADLSVVGLPAPGFDGSPADGDKTSNETHQGAEPAASAPPLELLDYAVIATEDSVAGLATS